MRQLKASDLFPKTPFEDWAICPELDWNASYRTRTRRAFLVAWKPSATPDEIQTSSLMNEWVSEWVRHVVVLDLNVTMPWVWFDLERDCLMVRTSQVLGWTKYPRREAVRGTKNSCESSRFTVISKTKVRPWWAISCVFKRESLAPNISRGRLCSIYSVHSVLSISRGNQLIFVRFNKARLWTCKARVPLKNRKESSR